MPCPRDVELRALEAGVVARLHEVARAVAAVERGHDRAAAVTVLAFALCDLAATVLALLHRLRREGYTTPGE